MNTVTMNSILERIDTTSYYVLPDSTITICRIKMKNGFTVLGESACVDPARFNVALGEKYSYEKAFNKIWELEGYLLAERMAGSLK